MAKLVVEQGNLAGQAFSLQRTVVSIGRGADNDVSLPEQGVSRHHARLERCPQGWLLTDLGSTNGTYVNGQRMREHEAYLLRPGDGVSIGGSLLLVQQAESASSRGRVDRPAPRGRERPHPVLLIVSAVGLIAVLVGIVVLLVVGLRPAGAPPTATAVDPMEHMMTALPLPTGFEDIVTAVVPLMPTGLWNLLLGGTPTPTP